MSSGDTDQKIKVAIVLHPPVKDQKCQTLHHQRVKMKRMFYMSMGEAQEGSQAKTQLLSEKKDKEL
jgi:hypothetical protein